MKKVAETIITFHHRNRQWKSQPSAERMKKQQTRQTSD